MRKIYLYNTAERKKVEFKAISKSKAGIYTCGPTVYWDQHIGNMYAFLFGELLVLTLKYFGYEVKWVVNITDVGHLTSDADEGEDKMEKGSRREGISAWEIAKKYENQFLESLDLLNIQRPKVISRATEHIEEQIDLIKKIEANGFSYKISDGIYFDTSKFPGYGDFANLNLSMIKEGARVEANLEKKNPTDFALWKFSPKNEKRQMEWESPWGKGFPGWHIECTAMSTKYLGNPFDIHTGGEDHIPIHHTNEIAQGFGAFGKQTANIWMHNAFITLGGGKMSKSSGKIMTIQQLAQEGYDPMAYRYLFLNSHYRKGLDFTIDSLSAAKNAYDKLNRIVMELPPGGKVDEDWKEKFSDKLADDLAMPEALAVMWKMLKDRNLAPEVKRATFEDFNQVLGLQLKEKEDTDQLPEEIFKLGQERDKARVEKNWPESDRLREILKEKGYLVEDTKEGGKIVKI